MTDNRALFIRLDPGDDVVIATFGGLSKVWLGPGLRMGWCIFSGPQQAAQPLIDAMGKLLRARLCASHPVQWAIQPALEGPQDHIAETNAILRGRRPVHNGVDISRARISRSSWSTCWT